MSASKLGVSDSGDHDVHMTMMTGPPLIAEAADETPGDYVALRIFQERLADRGSGV